MPEPEIITKEFISRTKFSKVILTNFGKYNIFLRPDKAMF